MIVRSLLMIIILISTCTSPILAESTGGGRDARSGELFSQATPSSGDARGEALVRKERGDQYASQENYKQAAEEYVKALEADSGAFNSSERLKMAVAVSWADRLDDAIHILRAILAEDPMNRLARSGPAPARRRAPAGPAAAARPGAPCARTRPGSCCRARTWPG